MREIIQKPQHSKFNIKECVVYNSIGSPLSIEKKVLPTRLKNSVNARIDPYRMLWWIYVQPTRLQVKNFYPRSQSCFIWSFFLKLIFVDNSKFFDFLSVNLSRVWEYNTKEWTFSYWMKKREEKFYSFFFHFYAP